MGCYPLHTAAGLCNIELTSSLIYLSQLLPVFGGRLEADEVAVTLGIKSQHIQGTVEVVSTGLRDILVPIACKEILKDICPDHAKIAALCVKYDTIGMHLFSIESEIHVRNFAPRYGIPEESATGSSNGALACYLHHHGLLQKPDYLFRQGDGMNLPSDIHVRLETEGSTIKKVACGGEVRIQEIREI
ncbi:MAG: PhzF family phenazine biosynthesis isomerase [Parachlamydia sp.]|nr:PhzF family phenazine biosynthesis isomerase [Parachlamydia sp.]